MELAKLANKLNNAVSGAVLDKGRLGRQGDAVLWIEKRSIPRVARALCEDEGFRFLENLSVIQVDDSFVITYFVRSEAGTLALRATAELKASGKAWVFVPSVSETWPLARAFEREQGALFGIRFGRADSDSDSGSDHDEAEGAGEASSRFRLRKKKAAS